MKDVPIDLFRAAAFDNCAEVIGDMRCLQQETET